MIPIFIDQNVVAAPVPAIAITQIVRPQPPHVRRSKPAREVPMLKRMIDRDIQRVHEQEDEPERKQHVRLHGTLIHVAVSTREPKK